MSALSGVYYPPVHALLSGGKDSMTTVKVLADADRLLGCVSFETGISTPDWKDFVADTCAKHGWPLQFFKTPAVYADLVRKYGFPGPGKHGMFMNYLKGRCVREFRKANPGGILASGTRINESNRRFINTKPVSVWEGTPILTPIYDWTTERVWHFFRANNFRRSPAYETLRVSGDCACGAYAEKDEADRLHYHYPTLGKQLDELGHSIRDDHPKRCEWGWGWNQPRKKTAKEAALCNECGDAPPLLALMRTAASDASKARAHSAAVHQILSPEKERV